MTQYKLQVQDDDAHPDQWRDVTDDAGALYLFDKEAQARAKLSALFPVLVKLEQFAAGPKRARVVVVSPYQDRDEANE